MKKFILDKNYYIREPDYTGTAFLGESIRLGFEGRKLIADYYHEKYQTNIKNLIIPNLLDLIPTIKRISEKQQNKSEYREVLAIDDGHDFFPSLEYPDQRSHSISVSYLKEKREEIILIIDSFPPRKLDFETGKYKFHPSHHEFTKKLFSECDIPTYTNNALFQQDKYSCHTIAVGISRDICAINPTTNTYYIPNLLSLIKGRMEDQFSDCYFGIKLIDNFLRFSQFSNVIKKNQEKENRIIHPLKNETFDKFKERYLKLPENFNFYPKLKGLKYANLTEIQFYAAQLKAELKDKWLAHRSSFIEEAKKILRSNDEIKHEKLYEYSSHFLSNLNPDFKELIKQMNQIL